MSPLAAQNRLVAGTLISGLLFIALALFFVLPTDEVPPLWVPLAQLAAGVAVHALVPSLDDEAAVAQGMVRYQGAMILRFALIEAIAIVSIALAFVLPEGGFLTFAGGAVVSLVLMAVHVWPWARPVGRSADALEAAGRRSGLREQFGHASSGPIQRL